MRVLIVDDEPLARSALERVLRARKDIETVDSAADAFAALNLLQERPYDALLLDIRMPELSGIELVDRLKKRKMPVPSIIFVTAHNQHAVAAFEKHAVDYVLKPFSDDRIHQALDTAVHRSQSERAARFMELLPQLESLVVKSSRIAIKTKKSILFIDPADVGVLFTAGIHQHGCTETRALRIYPNSPVNSSEYFVCRGDSSVDDGRVHPAHKGREGIGGFSDLQKESEIAGALLGREQRFFAGMS
jgi:DNA-binding LytR/AlgR family response regulator